MNLLKQYILLFIVFLTGACVLIIEVVATRILSVYFGNTIFSVSSILSVVLAGLSVGYYLGGKAADRYPSEKLFYSIIAISGLSVLMVNVLTVRLLPHFGNNLSITRGPIVSALVLFFLPCLLLGSLTPFTVKLHGIRFPKKGIGSISGEVFFWSTLGSIVGSLLAGFVLIPQFGIVQIVLGVGVTLIILGALPLSIRGITKRLAILTVCGFLLVMSLLPSEKKSEVVYSKDGFYEKITITDGHLNGRPVRFFKQDRSNSGAMYLDSNELVQEYTKYYVLHKLFTTEVKNVLVIGGGAYSIPKAMLKDLSQVQVHVAEIEPSLFDLAQRYFSVIPAERLHNYTQDGRRFLKDNSQKYDVIFSDVYYSLYSIPYHFTTYEFFDIAKKRLNENGVFIANLLGDLSRKKPSLILSDIKTFLSVFNNSYFFAIDSPGRLGIQNFILVGYNSDKKLDFHDTKYTQDANPLIQTLGQKLIDLERFDLSSYPVLTDNYSPVEYLTAKILREGFDTESVIDGKEMLAVIDQQLRFGPRYLSAAGHLRIQKFLQAELEALVVETITQTWEHINHQGQKYELTNIIGRLFPETGERIILATHYDSKKIADKDTPNKGHPVPGANDSASGVAVLVELARFLQNTSQKPNIGIDIVFFDGEEGEEDIGNDYSNWKPIGSTYFTEHLSQVYPGQKPTSAIILDMVCDKDLRIEKELSSTKNAQEQVEKFWSIGMKINSRVFRNSTGKEILDDHTPLSEAGIPSVLVIDFEYPPFHTSADTLDKCSPESLATIAKTVANYIYSFK